MVNPLMKLPMELVAFLKQGTQLAYDSEMYEPAGVKLLALEELKLQRFPVVYGEGMVGSDENPHPDGGVYLVEAINLVADCEDYDPVGILVWLPVEERFGAWDSDHLHMEVFGETVTWSSIVANPGPHVEASCGGEGFDPPFQRLQPWLHHPFTAESVEHPQDID